MYQGSLGTTGVSGNTSMFNVALDLGATTSSLHNLPTVFAVPPNSVLSGRIPISAGVTKASDFQAQWFEFTARLLRGN
jgi:hypothetical protein